MECGDNEVQVASWYLEEWVLHRLDGFAEMNSRLEAALGVS